MSNEIISSFNTTVSNLNASSNFKLKLGEKGGYVVFSNSGRGGESKDFILGLDSLLTTFQEIQAHIDVFASASNYEEKTWRDLCPKYLSVNSVVTTSTVQTKPFFCTLSKIINWGTQSEKSNDSHIDITEDSLKRTIEKLDKLIELFNPSANSSSTNYDLGRDVIGLTGSIAAQVQQILVWLSSVGLLNEFYALTSKNTESNSFGGDLYSVIYQDQLKLTSMFLKCDHLIDASAVSQGDKVRFIIEPLPKIVEGAFWYLSKEWTNGSDSRLDFKNFVLIFNSLYKERAQILLKEGNWSLVILKKLTFFPKPFLILAGSSGTGKSRWVRKQAYNTWPRTRENTPESATPPNYQLVAVRPNWHDSSEVLGYITRVNGVRYVTTEFVRFLVQAWVHWAKERTTAPDTLPTPFYLCLDEMNLAPVEQYFAEYLSVVESRRVADSDAFGSDVPVQGFVISDALIPKGEFEKLVGAPWMEFCKETGIVGSPVASMLLQYGLILPPNLYVVGTVNMDETTHSFSRKVLDRAFVWEMPIGDLTLESSLTGADRLAYPATHIAVELPRNTEAHQIYSTHKANADRVLAWLQEVNDALQDTPFQVSYRVRDELLLLMASRAIGNDENKLWQCLDDGLYSKILPRIEGDEARTRDALVALAKMLIAKSTGLSKEWTALPNSFDHSVPFEALRLAKADRDFLGKVDDADPFSSVLPWRRSLAKIRSMLLKLEGQFTSFWD